MTGARARPRAAGRARPAPARGAKAPARAAKLYEGKAKIVYATRDPGLVIQYFKDDATAFNAQKRGTIAGKGVVNNRVSAHLFGRLERAGVPTHYVATLSDREMLCRRLEIITVETVVRNVVAGSLAKRTGLEEGTAVARPVVELYLKSDALGDPMLNDDHVFMLKLASPRELAWIRRTALRVNAILRPHLARRGLRLVDFKLEFGRQGRRLYLGDEISPDTCRLWDAASGEKLDKDRFRRDLGGVEEAYREVDRRLAEPA